LVLGVARLESSKGVVSAVKSPPRRYWYDHRGAIVWIICLLLVAWRAYESSQDSDAPALLEEGIHEVGRVVDGDTLLMASGARVRLQGINSPETVREDYPVEAWGPEASQFTSDFVERANNHVRLTFGLERKDRYDRFLAFVWNGDVMLNEELVRAGLARARLEYRYSGLMKRRLAEAQDEARTAGRGIWSSPATFQENAR
jgi:micrococcal nuclease